MRNKSEVIDKFKEYIAENGTPRTLRSDNGAEYTSRKFKEFCRDLKVKQEFTVPETPQQNGVAERFNRTLVEMGRCLLIQAKLPKKYWVRALDTATHIRNLTVSANSNEGKSPFELFTKKTARTNHLRVFGCTAYVKKRNVNLQKLDARSVKAKFVGYDSKSTAYILQVSRMLPPNCSPRQNHSPGILNVFIKLHETIAHGLHVTDSLSNSPCTLISSLYTEPCICRGSYVIHGCIKY